MKIAACLITLIAVVGADRTVSAEDTRATGPRVGEVRAIAVDRNNPDAVAGLQHDGWIPARGQLLDAREFPALYQTVGRTWTADGVSADHFAIPDLPDLSPRVTSADNPSGVLGPGDLVTSGRVSRQWLRPGRVSYWIYTGQPAALQTGVTPSVPPDSTVGASPTR